MKIYEPGIEIFPLPESTDKTVVYKHLEKIGRVCYKSEDKIDINTAFKFLRMLKERKHWAMLEHYIFTFEVPEETYFDIIHPARFTSANADLVSKMPFIKYTMDSELNELTEETESRCLISASATALNYLWECECYKNGINDGLVQLCVFMEHMYPEIMKDPSNIPLGQRLINQDIRLVSHHELSKMSNNTRLIHDSATVKFTVDRGVTHELVRHRPCSWAQESTRYCNYSGELGVINPSFFTIDSPKRRAWAKSVGVAQKIYNDLLSFGATPQEARSVLPNSTKAEIIMTASLMEFRHFFKMRADRAAHPQMREVVVPLLKTFITLYPGMFDDLEYLTEDYNNGT